MTACPCCASRETAHLLSTPPVPVHSCVLVRDARESLATPRRPIDLWHCATCGFLWNISFESSLIHYGPDYEGTQIFSPVFRAYLAQLGRDWIARYAPKARQIVEAGCGQGEFLEVLAKVTTADLQGFDPAARTLAGARFRITATELPQGGEQADLVINRMTLEHVPDPLAFTRVQATWLAKGRTLISQVPHAARMIADHLTCDLLYEHVNYFTPTALSALMIRARLAPLAPEITFDGQHLGMAATKDTPGARAQTRAPVPTDFARAVAAFGPEWRARLTGLHSQGRAIWLWGAGSRATAFLAHLGTPGLVAGVIDINPNRAGSYVLGTEVMTHTPQAISGKSDIALIVMNPIYSDEIARNLQEIGTKAEIFAI